MPRRPRPTSRKPPVNALSSDTRVLEKNVKLRPKLPKSSEGEGTSDAGSLEADGSEDLDDDGGEYSSEEEEEEDSDADAPRVAQWVDDEDLQSDSDDGDSTADEQTMGRASPSSLVRIFPSIQRSSSHF